jgi:integrase
MTGNITRTGKHSWRLKFDCPRDPVTGKRVTRRVTVRGSRRDAERELTKMLAQRDSGSLISPSKMLLAEFLEEWLNSWCRANLSPGTAERYQYAIRTQIIPFFGRSLRLQQLQPAHITSFHAHSKRPSHSAQGACGCG